MIILGILPWCLTPELYAAKPEYVQGLADFVRSRPAQPLDAFARQSNAVLAHDVESQLRSIKAPTQITFGRRDSLTSTRFTDRLTNGIRGSEVVVFEDCAHAAMYERVEEFNTRTLAFLTRQAA
jgi:pimeloyl-ACP methyl ester carboxylesterase